MTRRLDAISNCQRPPGGLFRGMHESYDVAVIGGAFSGASAALLLKRDRPDLRIVIIERAEHFDRKVGEASTEISGTFMTKCLSINNHLNHHHVPKHGLRFWFHQNEDDCFSQCGELGPLYQVRLPTYQLDRAVLDEHVLSLAVEAGAELIRPARMVECDIAEGESTLQIKAGDTERTIKARWVIDASGQASVLARKFQDIRQLPEHPTNSVWARFRNVRDWDGHELRSRFPGYASSCQACRASATNHLTGYGWWVWIIPLKGGDYSAGIVYDQRLFTLPPGESLGARLKAHLLTHPVGREIFGAAEPVEGDVKAYSNLSYYTETIAGPGWQIVGDAAGFMDPLYSQGLDYCSWTVTSAVTRIKDELDGKKPCLKDINARWTRSYRNWFEALYKDKYYYLGDQQLMTAAFFLDLGSFFFGPVRSVVNCTKYGFSRFPFDGPIDGAVSKFMAFYNRRLSLIAQKRKAAGVYGASNLGTRTLTKGFEPTNFQPFKGIWKGLKTWLRAEVQSASLPLPKSEPTPQAKLSPVVS